jgi:hypothetical protein
MTPGCGHLRELVRLWCVLESCDSPPLPSSRLVTLAGRPQADRDRQEAANRRREPCLRIMSARRASWQCRSRFDGLLGRESSSPACQPSAVEVRPGCDDQHCDGDNDADERPTPRTTRRAGLLRGLGRQGRELHKHLRFYSSKFLDAVGKVRSSHLASPESRRRGQLRGRRAPPSRQSSPASAQAQRQTGQP